MDVMDVIHVGVISVIDYSTCTCTCIRCSGYNVMSVIGVMDVHVIG